MMSQSRLKASLILLALGFGLLNYQNCAPVNSQSYLNNGSNGDRVGIIDGQLNKGLQISFYDSQLTVGSAITDLEVDGVCEPEQNGSVLFWQVVNSQNQVVFSGNSICDAQNFRVFLASLDQLPCGEYSLKARFGFDKGDEVLILRECQN